MIYLALCEFIPMIMMRAHPLAGSRKTCPMIWERGEISNLRGG